MSVFLVKTLTLLLHFFQPNAQLAAKNRFLDEFVWVQNGGSLRMMQNEYLFQWNAICNRFWALATFTFAVPFADTSTLVAS
ncbi:MAG: hypothetical protein ACFNVK_09040, partial [Prevotella sp.]